MPRECPSKSELLDFSQGEIRNHRRQAQIEAHLDRCPQCLAVVEHQPTPLVAALRDAVEQPSTFQESGCQNAIERAMGIAKTSDPPARSVDSTKTNSSRFDVRVGTNLGRFRIQSRLGMGGMGIVYRAIDSDLEKTVALKLMHTYRVDSARAVARFKRELEFLHRLSHPNIVAAYDTGTIDDTLFLAMELIEGVDVAQMARLERPMLAANACEIVRQAASGLAYIHEHGLIHRDLKPANLMLAQSDQGITVKILDLGLAFLDRDHHDNSISPESLTSLSQMMGTIDFMSPEQCLDSHDVDVRSDIFSLGATLFRLLAGDSMWSVANYKTQGRKLKAILGDPIPSIRETREDLPNELVDIVDKMLQRDREQRFQRSEDLEEALSSFADGHQLQRAFDLAVPLAPTFRETIADTVGVTEAIDRDRPKIGSDPELVHAPAEDRQTQPKVRTKRGLVWLVLPLIVVAGLVGWNTFATPGRFDLVVVTNTHDAGPGSLRQAIIDTRPEGVIKFRDSLSGATVALESGGLVIDRSLTIDASPLAEPITIDAGGKYRVIKCEPDIRIAIKHLVLTGGFAAGTTPTGGGILSEADLSLTDVTVIGNTSVGSCGGIRAGDGGSLTMERCNVIENNAISGTGVYVSSCNYTIRNSTIANNSAVEFAGIFVVKSRGLLENTTLTGNTANHGQALIVTQGAGATLRNVTVVNNPPSTIAPGYSIQAYYGSGLTLENCVIASNGYPEAFDLELISSDTVLETRGTNVVGNFKSLDGHVLADDVIVESSDSPLNLRLAELGDHGGSVLTMPPLSGSLLIDSGAISSADVALQTDARGEGRTLDGNGDGEAITDVGAVEFNPAIETESAAFVPKQMVTPLPVQDGTKRRLLQLHHQFIQCVDGPITLNQSSCEIIPFVTCPTYEPDSIEQKEADAYWTQIQSQFLDDGRVEVPDWMHDPRRRPMQTNVTKQVALALDIDGVHWHANNDPIIMLDLRDDLTTDDVDEAEEVGFLVISRFDTIEAQVTALDFKLMSQLEVHDHPIINGLGRNLYTPFTRGIKAQEQGVRCGSVILQHYLSVKFLND